jgi:hypothetical protein
MAVYCPSPCRHPDAKDDAKSIGGKCAVCAKTNREISLFPYGLTSGCSISIPPQQVLSGGPSVGCISPKELPQTWPDNADFCTDSESRPSDLPSTGA